MIVHSFEPVYGQVGGLYLWFYGLSYTAGFLSLWFWFARRARNLGMSATEVRALVIAIAAGVLLGGRVVEVLVYERAFYFARPELIPAVWLGGMSTHGLLIGAAAGVLWHCLRYQRDFLQIADQVAVPGAAIMGFGRFGNFIDGQIAGAVSDMPWAVLFPDFDLPRHPVVLYDGLKNLLIFAGLVWLARRAPPRGVLLGHFLFWYGGLRLWIDQFREYRVELFGFAPGQELNLLMAVVGAGLLVWAYRRRRPATLALDGGPTGAPPARTGVQLVLIGALLALPNVIPSDWTYDVITHYADRVPGIERSFWYPEIGSSATGESAEPN